MEVSREDLRLANNILLVLSGGGGTSQFAAPGALGKAEICLGTGEPGALCR